MINYDILLPSTDDNRVFIKDKEFIINEISKINIDYRWYKATYWFSLVVEFVDRYSQVLLKKNAKLKTILILGEHRFEIHGELEVLSITEDRIKRTLEYDCYYCVDDTKSVVNNPRKELKVKRTDLIDLIGKDD